MAPSWRVLFLVFVLSQPLWLISQNRENAPLLELAKKPLGVVDKKIDGWTLSLDGQWIQGKSTLAIRANARDQEAYESKDAQLGMDNIERLELREAFWGEHRIFCLAKFIREGEYRYKQRQSGWNEWTDAWFCLIDPADITEIARINDTLYHKVEVRLLDAGWLHHTKTGDFKEALEARARPNPNFERTLTVYLKYNADRSLVRFHMVSLHPVFGQAEGVRRDLSINGRSILGSDELFQICHYECPSELFRQILPLK